MSCQKCGNGEVRYLAKNYPKNSNEIGFCSKGCLQKWLIGKEITFGLTGIAGIIIVFIVWKGTPVKSGVDVFMNVFVSLIWFLAAFSLRKMIGLFLKDNSRDGGEEALSFALKGALVLLTALTVVIPVIWIVREVKQFVRLNKLLKENKN